MFRRPGRSGLMGRKRTLPPSAFATCNPPLSPAVLHIMVNPPTGRVIPILEWGQPIPSIRITPSAHRSNAGPATRIANGTLGDPALTRSRTLAVRDRELCSPFPPRLISAGYRHPDSTFGGYRDHKPGLERGNPKPS
jgi:hypothetical protein